MREGRGVANWEEKIYHIHQAEKHIGNFRLVITVTGKYQHCCDNVVGEHLPMVFPSLFDVNHQDLLQPKGILHENVPL